MVQGSGLPWLKPCGTEAAYKRHLRKGEAPCRACLEANSQTAVRRRQAARELGRPLSGRPHKKLPCGSYAAYVAHTRYSEPIDGACRQAARDANYGRAAS